MTEIDVSVDLPPDWQELDLTPGGSPVAVHELLRSAWPGVLTPDIRAELDRTAGEVLALIAQCQRAGARQAAVWSAATHEVFQPLTAALTLAAFHAPPGTTLGAVARQMQRSGWQVREVTLSIGPAIRVSRPADPARQQVTFVVLRAGVLIHLTLTTPDVQFRDQFDAFFDALADRLVLTETA
jgi:hypothetical protein